MNHIQQEDSLGPSIRAIEFKYASLISAFLIGVFVGGFGFYLSVL